MREEVLNNVIERMSNDPEFMKQLETKPGKALFDAGLTWDEVAEIKKSAENPQAETLGERSSAGFTTIGKIWYELTGQCGCQSSWITSGKAIVPFCT
jgi:hypothetical protein